jgi:hypothetical protein
MASGVCDIGHFVILDLSGRSQTRTTHDLLTAGAESSGGGVCLLRLPCVASELGVVILWRGMPVIASSFYTFYRQRQSMPNLQLPNAHDRRMQIAGACLWNVAGVTQCAMFESFATLIGTACEMLAGFYARSRTTLGSTWLLPGPRAAIDIHRN